MTPGHPIADIIFDMLLPATASAYAVAREIETKELRHAMAALSVFRGPGTFARDVAMQVIRDELAKREGA